MRTGVLAALLVFLGASSARGDSRPLFKCRNALTSQAEKYADARRDLIERCGERLLACEIALERNGTDPTDCRTAARLWCSTALSSDSIGYLGRAIAVYGSHIGRYCDVIDFSGIIGTGSGQLGFGNDADCGAAVDLGTLITCLRGRLDESVDSSFADRFPRAGLLLESAGLGLDFPNVPRPAVTDVAIAATTKGSGTLVSPGTIASAVGSAVRFSGDASTLPCGGGTNGSVTVTIHSFGALCADTASILEQFTLYEPYGTDRGGTAGPFSGDATYCLELKDGSCTDLVTGVIDVP